jgi:hypothetical protein
LRGIESQLQGGLEDDESEIGEEIADGVFGLVEDLSGCRAVDGSGDIGAELVEVLPELFAEGVGRQLRGSVHDRKSRK